MEKTKLYWYYAASICLLLFAMIAYFVVSNVGVLAGLDDPIIHLIRGNLTPEKTTIFKYFTKFGNTSTIVLLTALVAGLLYVKAKDKVASYWLLINIILIQGAGNFTLKKIFDRPRPDVEHLVTAYNNSFPSGHAMGSMLFYGTLIFLAHRYIQNKGLRLTIQILFGILILLVGTSRIYLGVHYPSDILGGYLLGAAWLCFSYPFFEKYEFIQNFKGKR
ncbi:phosphatase PAP2 family protein [Vagococcus jeotgali]|uniref:phosphatase PAP2 family protein n=1 Tax=Vagococcus jeotgali TaxID=3109030 RepID=UPI002DD8F866|nr:phosphatase PAP2 family protein [Vagococcus sp. B2T-5]